MQQLNKKIKKTLVNGQCVKLRFGGQLTHKHTHNQAAIHKQTDRGKSNDSWQEEQQQNTIHWVGHQALPPSVQETHRRKGASFSALSTYRLRYGQSKHRQTLTSKRRGYSVIRSVTAAEKGKAEKWQRMGSEWMNEWKSEQTKPFLAKGAKSEKAFIIDQDAVVNGVHSLPRRAKYPPSEQKCGVNALQWRVEVYKWVLFHYIKWKRTQLSCRSRFIKCVPLYPAGQHGFLCITYFHVNKCCAKIVWLKKLGWHYFGKAFQVTTITVITATTTTITGSLFSFCCASANIKLPTTADIAEICQPKARDLAKPL